MGDEDEDEGCAVELQITEANLTGHEEKVSVENFALLKVLGTGGEKPLSLAWCFGPSARPLAWTWAWAWLLGRSPHPFPA